MAKFQALTIIVASFCLLFLFGIASSHDGTGEDQNALYAEGQVYCDTCRVGFFTRISEWMTGAKVRIECHNPTTRDLTLGVEGVTNSSGWYSIPVHGDHEDDICEVALVSSPRPDCDGSNERRDSSRVLLTKNVGIASNCRYINPLGFAIKKSFPTCEDVLKELELA